MFAVGPFIFIKIKPFGPKSLQAIRFCINQHTKIPSPCYKILNLVILRA
jgi:hypothetical protein